MKDINNIKRIVVKVGSSTISHISNGLNLQKIEQLANILSDIKKRGIDIVLVSSGAVSAGAAKLKMDTKPTIMKEKQAAASIGQCELMFTYDKYFLQCSQIIAQLLLTKTVITNPTLKANAINTIDALLAHNVIPIVNENDSVAVDELAIGDNDSLGAITAYLCKADLLILLSDIDGLYSDNPKTNPNAKFIPLVENIDDQILSFAKSSHNELGTGGMLSKIQAATFSSEHQIPTIIANGADLHILYDILDNKYKGTLFKC